MRKVSLLQILFITAKTIELNVARIEMDQILAEDKNFILEVKISKEDFY